MAVGRWGRKKRGAENKEPALVKNVSVEVKAGDMIGLIGPNGAGKSTLLRALAGLSSPTSGEVFVGGASLLSLPHSERAKALAYLPQQEVPAWPLSVEHLVGLGRAPWHRPLQGLSERDGKAIQRAMDLTEINELCQRSIDTLSGGELRRAQLARVLATEAPMLIADEPITALDPYHQLHVMEVLAEYAGRDGGVIAALHDLGLAARFCKQLILLHRGEIVAQGAPGEVLTKANLADVYGVSAQVYCTDEGVSVVPLSRI